jgi:hypothetical protein
MPDTTASAAPDDYIAGSIRQTTDELVRLLARLGAGGRPGEATAALLITLGHELREVAAQITARPAGDDGTSAVRSFLVAVTVALDIPRPATSEDERGYLRTRSLRAGEVLKAAASIAGSAPDPVGLNWRWSAAQLTAAAGLIGTGGYRHAAARPEVTA